MASRTMIFKEWGGVLLCAHSADAPSRDEWAAYVKYCRTLPASCNKALVVTGGGGPNVVQRGVLQNRYLSRHPTYVVAVLTDSALVRGIVEAMNWFNPHTQSFAYDEGRGVPAAMEHLGIDASGEMRLQLEVEGLRRALAEGSDP